MAEKRTRVLGAIADRLFREMLVPLVLGGELRPGRPIGGKNALALGPFSDVLDKELLSHVNLARIRVARRLLPIDRLEAPTPAEWALAAMLHDVVQCAHPEMKGVFRGRAPLRLLQLVSLTAERVPAASSVGDAVSRHTWFSRALQITRTDSTVSFWVGKRQFLGQEPPGRLLAWPELRRVHVDKTPHMLVDLPSAGGHVAGPEFENAVTAWLRKTPLTDLATCSRSAPTFAWSAETVAFASTRAGRTLALRALDELVGLDVDVALGRATKALIAARAQSALAVVATLLGERALASAVERAERATPEGEAPPEDAMIARAVGAFGATELLASNENVLKPDLARAVRWQLQPWTQTPAAQTTKAILAH
jgi:hypothetical protein